MNFAEAQYELNGTVAYEQLNQLRSRAGMPDFTVNPQSADPSPTDYGYPISDELYEIRRERRVELALEGFRADDYLRWAAHTLFQEETLKGYPFDPEEFPDYNPSLDEKFPDRISRYPDSERIPVPGKPGLFIFHTARRVNLKPKPDPESRLVMPFLRRCICLRNIFGQL